jgi:hypothetical protein
VLVLVVHDRRRLDKTQTGYGFSAGRAFDDLDAADASTSAERAVVAGATKPRTQRLPVVLDPLVARRCSPASGRRWVASRC